MPTGVTSKFEDIEACEQAGMTPYVPKPQRGSAVRKSFFAKDEFRYDPGKDIYICPAGERLGRKYESKSRDLMSGDMQNPSGGDTRNPATLHSRGEMACMTR